MTQKQPKLRGSKTAAKQQSKQPTKKPTAKASKPLNSLSHTQTVSVPASYGTRTKLTTPTTRNISGGIRLTGSDYVDSVDAFNQTNFEIGSLLPIHPAYWTGSGIANHCRVFAKYRFIALEFEYVTASPTSQQGAVVITTTKAITEPAINSGSSTSFLPQALSTGRAELMPLWMGTTIPVQCDEHFRLTDPFTSTDIDDNINGEVIIYTQAAASFTAGYLIVRYVVEFIEPMYTLHATFIPAPAGTLGSCFLIDSANETAANAMIVAYSSGVNVMAPATIDVGAVFKMVLSVDQTTFAAGTNSTTALNSYALTASTSSTTTNQAHNLTLVNGTTFFGVYKTSGNLVLYQSYESAVAGGIGGMIGYQTTVAAKTTWYFTCYPVRITPYLGIAQQ